MSHNSDNFTTKQQRSSKNPEINRLKKNDNMYKDLKALGEKIDQGFLNLQIFLENLFS
jgi:hypothetical protein